MLASICLPIRKKKEKRFMNLLDKLEKKIGWLAIPNLVSYVIGGNVMVFVLQILMQIDLEDHLSFYLPAILSGQVWRMITFVFIPPVIFGGSMFNLFISAIILMFYYNIGRRLEVVMGRFAFTIFYFLGILALILLSLSLSIPVSGEALAYSLYFAYAYYFPNHEILFMYFIPVKIKYLAYLSGCFLLWQLLILPWMGKIIIIAGLFNFLVFFGKKIFYQPIYLLVRRQNYKHKVSRAHFKVYSNPHIPGPKKNRTSQARHFCEECGRTDLDGPNLEFRYCSKCQGYHEYCMDHLHSHKHKENSEV